MRAQQAFASVARTSFPLTYLHLIPTNILIERRGTRFANHLSLHTHSLPTHSFTMALLTTNKRKPSEYPALPFHLIRLTQLISSLIVASVLIFFVDQLHRSSFYIPWTFLLVSPPPTFQIHKPLSLTQSTTASNRLPPLHPPLPHNHLPPPHPLPLPPSLPPPHHSPHHPLASLPLPPNLEPNLDARPPLHPHPLAQLRRHNGLSSLQSPHRLRRHSHILHHPRIPPRCACAAEIESEGDV